VWAIGVLAYEMCTGGPPFEAETANETYTRIRGLDLKLPGYLSKECGDFIALVLKVDPNERPTVTAMKNHPWILN